MDRGRAQGRAAASWSAGPETCVPMLLCPAGLGEGDVGRGRKQMQTPADPVTATMARGDE